jgi:transcriptional regulator with XRE-family HTH domain
MPRKRTEESEYRHATAWIETSAGKEAIETDPERLAWFKVGELLFRGRQRFQISKREAARRAGISEALWRQLEGGGEMLSTGSFLPNPRPENLYAAAVAVDIDPERLFDILGRDTPEVGPTVLIDKEFASKVRRLHQRDLLIVDYMIDLMLATREYADDAPDGD